MSTASYKKNHHVFWVVRCTFVTKGKTHTYYHHGAEQSYTRSLEVAKENHLWSKHPTFRAEVVGIIFE